MSDIKMQVDDQGMMTINIFHLLELVPDDRLPELIESLSCAEAIIQHVCDQIVYGCTENGYSGSWCTNGDTALQKAKTHIALNSSDVAKLKIESLELEIRCVKKNEEMYMNKYFDLYHKEFRHDRI